MDTYNISSNSFRDHTRIHQGDIVYNNNREVFGLPIAQDALFDSRADEYNEQCHPDTRIDLLRQIKIWAKDPRGKCIFWLNGMAGTGKSTISRTIANCFKEERILGASFFFKRGEGDRGRATRFFTTIAKDLSDKVPAVAGHIKNAIKNDPDVSRKALKEQFEKLILQPLNQMEKPKPGLKKLIFQKLGAVDKYEIPRIVAVVVDALDECDSEKDTKLLIYLLSQAKSLKSTHLRFFITSRPELPLRLGFKDIQGTYQGVELHQIPESVVERDIATFLHYKLGRIRDEYNSQTFDELRLPLNWPGEHVVQTLARRAVPLFIFAATLVRFVAEWDQEVANPMSQLNKILHYRTTGNDEFDKLGATYNPVLSQLLINRTSASKARIRNEFGKVVGSIILLEAPLSASSLSQLLQIPMDHFPPLLNHLHSVLHIPSQANSPIRPFHLSFRDFLVHPANCSNTRFWVKEKETHQYLAQNCLRIMNETLRTNICRLQEPGTPFSSIDPEKINDNLRPEVQYACRSWAYHLQQASALISDDDEVYTFLNRHFLHWLEALSLAGRASESLGMIKTLQGLVQSNSCEIVKFLNDANRFVLATGFIIQQAPLQVYLSALAFAPKRSIVRIAFEQEITGWVSLLPKVEDNWSQCLRTLEGHNGPVCSVAFSHDSKLVASASDDGTVRIWSAETDECQQTLESHNNSVRSVAFSHDSKLVASVSGDGIVRIWSAETGECQQTLEGHNGPVRSIAFSHDSKLVVSASGDGIVRIWSAETGECQQTLEGHNGPVRSVAFSHDSKLVASASDDETVRIWSAETGECQQTLENHNGPVCLVAFSHDSKLVASASGDGIVRIWSAETGECQQTLEGHNNWVRSVAFSHDSKLVASALGDGTVRIWSAETGEYQQTLESHNSWVRSVAFSHDSKLVASVSGDGTVRIWSAETGECQQAENIGIANSRLSFDPKGLFLYTDIGAISLQDSLWHMQVSDAPNNKFSGMNSYQPLASDNENHRSGYGISTDRSWITTNGHNLLWLPIDYRPSCSTVSHSTVVIGTSMGKVFIMGFSA